MARRRLDERLVGLDARIGPRPPRGWLRAIREALGMSTGEMAARMGVSQPRINQLERAETDGSIRMSTLERAAEALGCRVRYVLVPDEPLADMVRGRANQQAAATVAAVTQTMQLEDQAPDPEAIRRQVEALAGQLVDACGLWADR